MEGASEYRPSLEYAIDGRPWVACQLCLAGGLTSWASPTMRVHTTACLTAGLLSILLCPSDVRAQSPSTPGLLAEAMDLPSTVVLTGSVRARVETIDGQARAGFNTSDTLVNLRSTLFTEFDTGVWRFGAGIYDSRVWGGNTGSPVTTNEVNALELVQGYAAIDLTQPFGPTSRLSVLAGRFATNIGSRRLVADDDYRNTTNGFTGVHVDTVLGRGVRATGFYALPQLRLPSDLASVLDNRFGFDEQSFDLVLWGGAASRARTVGPAMTEVSYFRLSERDAPNLATRDRQLHTLGGRIIRDPGVAAVDYETEVFYQTGSIRASTAAGAQTLDVSAWFTHAELGYSGRHRWKPHVSVEFDYASGDDASDTFTRFDSLYGTRRSDLAPSGLYSAVGRANILTPGLRLELVPHARLDAFVSYRLLWLASATDGFSTSGVRDVSGESGRFAGQQVDTRARYWLVPNRLRAEVDAVWLAKGRFLRDAPNAPANGNTGYLSLNLTQMF